MIPETKKGGQVIIDSRMMRLFRLKKGVMTAARLVNDRLGVERQSALDDGRKVQNWRPLMVTLTYRDKDDWLPDQISRFMKTVMNWAGRQGFKLPYIWVMELQKRGAPHYHVLLWVPSRLLLPRPDKQGWWSYGSTNVLAVKNAVGYVAKYASKFESKDAAFPPGARIHGIGGLTPEEKRIVAWWKLPKDLRQGDEGSCVWRRAPGGGWANNETGERVQSEWSIEGHSETWRFVRMVKRAPLDEESQAFKDWHAIRRLEQKKINPGLSSPVLLSERLRAVSKCSDVLTYQNSFRVRALRARLHQLKIDHRPLLAADLRLAFFEVAASGRFDVYPSRSQ